MSEEATGSAEAATETAVESSVDTGSSVDWKNALPDDVKTDPSLADIKDVGGLAKSYIHAQKMVGTDKIALPTENATPEEMSAFYDRLGRPKEYEFSKAELPEGMDYNEDMEKQMKTIMHSAGLTNKQANDLNAGYLKYMSEQFTNQKNADENQKAEWYKTLKTDLGKAFDEQVDLSQRAARELGGDDFLTWLDNTGQGNNPMFVKMFAKVGQMMAEAGAEPGKPQSFEMTPDSARAEIARLQRDPNFMEQYNNKETDGHKEAVKKFGRLFEYAYPDTEVST
tara:strand:+ start:4914 stop:5759 length:846 start_codon:yes stop_codon:yes gene_type:complete